MSQFLDCLIVGDRVLGLLKEAIPGFASPFHRDKFPCTFHRACQKDRRTSSRQRLSCPGVHGSSSASNTTLCGANKRLIETFFCTILLLTSWSQLSRYTSQPQSFTLSNFPITPIYCVVKYFPNVFEHYSSGPWKWLMNIEFTAGKTAWLPFLTPEINPDWMIECVSGELPPWRMCSAKLSCSNHVVLHCKIDVFPPGWPWIARKKGWYQNGIDPHNTGMSF